MKPLAGLLDLFFPPKCVFCGALTEGETVCRACRDGLPYFSGTTGKGGFFSECAAAFRYEGKARESLLRFKFGGRQNYAAGYAPFVAEAVTRELDGYDIISWPPVGARRRRERGYDQAELLAKETAKVLGVKAAPVLKKVRHTPRQSGIKGKAKRTANVLDAYKAINPGLIKGKRILLIDDIVTTGATLSECARTLLMAGAEEIKCAAAAYAKED